MTGAPSFPRHTRASVVFQCANGTRPYPWERPAFQQPEQACSSVRLFSSICLNCCTFCKLHCEKHAVVLFVDVS